uniref:Uncharacterized protein n=1 Tax=Romanomermis culicivorax TaxID=13658 RepID=A0A915KEZ5_ROMCU
MQSAGQRCEMLDSWKAMEGTVAFTALMWTSISDAVQTNDNGDYNLQKVFTKANNCWANRHYRLHFGKTECQPFEQAVVPAVGDMSWDSAGNAHSSVTMNHNAANNRLTVLIATSNLQTLVRMVIAIPRLAIGGTALAPYLKFFNCGLEMTSRLRIILWDNIVTSIQMCIPLATANHNGNMQS